MITLAVVLLVLAATVVPAPLSDMSGETVKLGFAENIAMSGAAAIFSKTSAAPIERIKLLDQNQDDLLTDDASVFLSFALGYTVTVSPVLLSYPIDTIRRRMMMTSGQAVKYKGSIDCAVKIIKNEGFMSMMKGAGANILRGVAGAGVLAGFDKFKEVYISLRVAKRQNTLEIYCSQPSMRKRVLT